MTTNINHTINFTLTKQERDTLANAYNVIFDLITELGLEGIDNLEISAKNREYCQSTGKVAMRKMMCLCDALVHPEDYSIEWSINK